MLFFGADSVAAHPEARAVCNSNLPVESVLLLVHRAVSSPSSLSELAVGEKERETVAFALDM